MIVSINGVTYVGAQVAAALRRHEVTLTPADGSTARVDSDHLDFSVEGRTPAGASPTNCGNRKTRRAAKARARRR